MVGCYWFTCLSLLTMLRKGGKPTLAQEKVSCEAPLSVCVQITEKLPSEYSLYNFGFLLGKKKSPHLVVIERWSRFRVCVAGRRAQTDCLT